MPVQNFPTKASEVISLSIDDFQMAWAISQAAVSGAMPMTSPSNRGTVRLRDGAQDSEIRFANIAVTQMIFAMKDHFGEDNPKWPAFMLRYWALQSLQHDSRMGRWVRQDGNRLLFFEGLMEAAASLPLHGKEPGQFEFDPDEFFSLVATVNSSGKYKGTGEVW